MPTGVGPATRAVEQIENAVNELADEEVVGRSLRDELVGLERSRARLDAQIARRLVEFQSSGEWATEGARSAAGWLAAKTRCTSRVANHRMHVARQLDEMPTATKAWRAGEIGSEHVAVMARVRSAARANQEFAVFEPALCDVAKAGTPDDVALVGRRWRDAVDAELGRDGSGHTADERDHDQRALHFSRTSEGVGYMDARFDAEGAEVVEHAIDKMYARLHQRDDPRSPAQQRHDAVVEIMREWSDDQPRGGNRPHVLLVEDVQTRQGDALGRCQSASGYQMSPDTMRRLACDAITQAVLIHNDGVPLAMGREERTFTPDQYRAMVVRDGGCRFPGCDLGPRHCEAHHITTWEDGGLTDLEHGILVCRGRGHHRFLHEGHGRVVGNANGTLEWYSSDGTCLGTSHPQRPPDKIITQQGKDAAAVRARAYALCNRALPEQAA
ncbi:MAG TPA: DUF222 domain-containing protein [Acidimicrobiia bacterium]|jgi:hypothetical protein